MFGLNSLFDNPMNNQLNLLHSQNKSYDIIKSYNEHCEEINHSTNLLQKQNIISYSLPQDLPNNTLTIKNYISEMVDIGYWLITETPLFLDGMLIALSACINATTGGIVFVRINREWTEASPIYTAQFAESGHKKSLVESKLRKPFSIYERKVAKSLPQIPAQFLKALKNKSIKTVLKKIDFSNPSSIIDAINEVNDQEGSIKSVIKSAKMLLLSSFTDYGLAEFLEENSESTLFLNSEGTELEKYLYSQPLELLLKCYGQEEYLKITGKRRTRFYQPALYMAVFGQLDIAMKIYGKSKLNARGFTGRILPYLHLGNLSQKLSYSEEEMENIYNNKITLCLNIFQELAKSKSKYFIDLCPKALAYFESFRTWCQGENCDIEFYPSWLEKLPGQAIRLALAAHIWQDPENAVNSSITFEEIRHGCDLAASCIQYAKYLYSPMGLQAQMDANKIVKSLQRLESSVEQDSLIRNGTTSTGLQQRTRLSRQAVNNALYHLSNRRFVAVEDKGDGNLQVRINHNFFSMKFE